MTESGIYEDIARRTGGSIYLGVVGPVRTGKSTFIKRFMETLVLPGIADVYMRERAKDELPQSGSGRTVMTAEPKFVPEEAVRLQLCEGSSVDVRLVDCVGYMIPGASGIFDGDSERMVTTPWFDREISFSEAAEVGTKKVITDHSTLGVMVTTDGSITEIPRIDYVSAEELVASELKAMGKPFVIVLNCREPDSTQAIALAQELEEKYSVSVARANCLTVGAEQLTEILKKALYEFPVDAISVTLPSWTDALPVDSGLRKELCLAIREAARETTSVRDVEAMLRELDSCGQFESCDLTSADLGSGVVSVRLELPREAYYNAISKQSGFDIRDDGELMSLLSSLGSLKDEYSRVSEAMRQVRETGYGVVLPSPDEMSLEEPQIVRSGGRYTVRLKAAAPAIHMLMTDIVTEVSPALGGEKISEEILSFLLQSCDGDMSRLWESNIFGKSLYDIASEGLTAKILSLPGPARNKLRDTLARIVNEGRGGLICIIL